MKVTPGFDRRNAGAYRWLLLGFALVSGLMFLASVTGKSTGNGPGGWHAFVWPACACLIAGLGYGLTYKSSVSFRYVGLTGVAFALAMFGFGMSLKAALLVGISSLVGVVGSEVFGKNGDLQVEDDDSGTSF